MDPFIITSPSPPEPVAINDSIHNMGPSVAQIGWRTENRVMKLPSSLCHRRGQSQLNLAYLLPCFYTASSSWATDAIDIASAELDSQRAINLRPSSGRRNNLILTTMTSTEAEEAGEAFALFLGALSSTETSFWFRILDQKMMYPQMTIKSVFWPNMGKRMSFTDTITSTSTVPTEGRSHSNISLFIVLSNRMIILLL